MLLTSLIILGIFSIIVCAYLSQVVKERFESMPAPICDTQEVVFKPNISKPQSTITEAIPTLSQNQCSISCCPGQFSCSGGCICLTDEQKRAIGTRGYNATTRESLYQ
jgi:hypothetical protein